MTAIFAYSSPTVAFVAADTFRSVPCSPLPSVIVRKAHFWSDQVVYGQTGTQFLSRLSADIQVAKQQWTDPITGAVYYDDSEDWLHKTFLRFQHSQQTSAIDTIGVALSNGSFLVAYVDGAGSGHGLARYDFAGGNRTRITSQVAADGTDEKAFLDIAKKHLAAMHAASSGPVSLDTWARKCMADAIARHPKAVGWPADLLIARPDGLGGRQVIQRRINSSSAVGDPLFLG